MDGRHTISVVLFTLDLVIDNLDTTTVYFCGGMLVYDIIISVGWVKTLYIVL